VSTSEPFESQPGQPPSPYPGSPYPGSYPQGPQYPQGAYPPPGYPPYGAAHGVDPYGRPYSDKSKIAAGLLQIFLGGFGIGRFYLGYVGIGIAQIIVTVITLGLGAIWGFIDGILILVGNVRDPQGRPLRD